MYCRTDPPHPKRNAKGLYPLHRVLLEVKLGRPLADTEEVHHINENKDDNSIDNLMVVSKAAHAALHRNKDAPPSVQVRCACGKVFQMKPFVFRLRAGRNKSGKVFCSRACGQRFSA